MTDQELVRNVAVAIPILIIAGVIGFTGSWFFAFCFIGVAWPAEKMIERVFSEEISSVSVKIDTFFNAVYDKIEPTWFGRFLNKIFAFSPVVANDVRDEAEIGPGAPGQLSYDSDSENNSSSTKLSRRSDSELDLSPLPTFSSVSAQANTRGIHVGLGQPIIRSGEFSRGFTESKSNGFVELVEEKKLVEEKSNLPSTRLQELEGSNLRRSFPAW